MCGGLWLEPDLFCEVGLVWDPVPKGVPCALLWRRRETLQAAECSGSQPRCDR